MLSGIGANLRSVHAQVIISMSTQENANTADTAMGCTLLAQCTKTDSLAV